MCQILTVDGRIVANPSIVTVDLYRHPTAHTALTPEQAALLDAIADDPAHLCRAAQGLLVLPPPATTAELRLNENPVAD